MITHTHDNTGRQVGKQARAEQGRAGKKNFPPLMYPFKDLMDCDVVR